MKEFFLVAAREIKVRGRTKSFVISLVASALLVAALAFLPSFFDDGDSSFTVGVVGQELAAGPDVTYKKFDTSAAAEEALRAGEVDAMLLDGQTLVGDGSVDTDLEYLMRQAYQQAQLTSAGVTLDPLNVSTIAGKEAPDGARVALANLLVILLFMLIMFTAMYVAIGIVEEKSSRIVEILLASVKPWQLLGGKIVGLVVLGFVNLLVIAAAGLGASAAAGEIGSLPSGIGGIVANTFLWFLLGSAFFAALAAAFGSLVSRQEDLNGVLSPMTMTLIITYLLSFFVATKPESTVAQVFSMLPPFSAMAMPVRFAATDVPLWQTLVSIVVMVVATIGVMMLGARIYQRAVLRTGARLKLAQLFK